MLYYTECDEIARARSFLDSENENEGDINIKETALIIMNALGYKEEVI